MLLNYPNGLELRARLQLIYRYLHYQTPFIPCDQLPVHLDNIETISLQLENYDFPDLKRNFPRFNIVSLKIEFQNHRGAPLGPFKKSWKCFFFFQNSFQNSSNNMLAFRSKRGRSSSHQYHLTL